MVKGEEGGDIEWADGGIKGLETRVGRECSISRGGPDSTVEDTYRMSPRRESHSVTAGGAAPRVRADKSSEFG